MSGRRRVKNVAYDEDDWGYGDDDSWEDEDDFYETPKSSSRAAAPTKGKSAGPSSTRAPSKATSAGSTGAAKAASGASSAGQSSSRTAGRTPVTTAAGSAAARPASSSGGKSASGASGASGGTPKAEYTCASLAACAPSAPPQSSAERGAAAPVSTSSVCTREDGKPEPLSLVIVGHVDAGKSTLIGQMLHSTGTVEGTVVQKLKKLSGDAGKGSFFLAWLCDEGDDERQRGVTIDVSVRVLSAPNSGRRLALVDAPGHREFVCNMLGGAALADVALLVVDTPRFEVGFNGQTKEHLLIVRCLGIQHFVVAMNKMDEVQWSEATYNAAVERLRGYMTGPEMNCALDQICFVPISAFRGVNVIDEATLQEVEKVRAEAKGRRKPDLRGLRDTEERQKQSKLLAKWWNGPALLEAIERVEVRTSEGQQQLLREPLAACVSDAWSPSSSSTDFHLSLKIVQGILRVGDTITGLPGNIPMVCKSLVAFGGTRQSCGVGDFVEHGVFSPAANHSERDALGELGVGSVLCAPSRLLPASTIFSCRLMVFRTELPLVQGRQFIAHIHTATYACSIRKILGVVNKKTGELQGAKGGKRAACAALGRGMVGLVEISTVSSVCVQPKSKTEKPGGKDLGTGVLSRIILREGGKTVAAGVIVDAA